MNSKILILCGPTGVGKTELSLKIAKRFDAEIVCVDSQTILKKFDIGTAKPSLEEQKQIPHHLLSIVEFGELFDVATFVEKADEAISLIQGKNKIPLLCGGAGLYFKALLHGIMSAPSRDNHYRELLEKRIAKEGVLLLHQELAAIDAKRASEIHPNDALRVIRALELHHQSGKKPSDLVEAHQFKEKRYTSLKIGLRLPLDVLYARIDKRVEKMLSTGWLSEVQYLLDQGHDLLNTKTQALGYQILAKHLQGKCSLEEAKAEIQKQTRNYAKRQMSWFRADNEVQWFEPDKEKEILKKVAIFLA